MIGLCLCFPAAPVPFLAQYSNDTDFQETLPPTCSSASMLDQLLTHFLYCALATCQPLTSRHYVRLDNFTLGRQLPLTNGISIYRLLKISQPYMSGVHNYQWQERTTFKGVFVPRADLQGDSLIAPPPFPHISKPKWYQVSLFEDRKETLHSCKNLSYSGLRWTFLHISKTFDFF